MPADLAADAGVALKHVVAAGQRRRHVPHVNAVLPLLRISPSKQPVDRGRKSAGAQFATDKHMAAAGQRCFCVPHVDAVLSHSCVILCSSRWPVDTWLNVKVSAVDTANTRHRQEPHRRGANVELSQSCGSCQCI